MSKAYYLPTDDGGKADLFEHFRDHVAPYIVTFGLTAPTLASQAADATYFRWLLTESASARGYALAINTWRDLLRDGNTPATSPAPVFPGSTPPTAVEPGIIPRFIALVRSLKAHAAYTEAIGNVLQIEGAETAEPDRENARPDLTGAKVVADEVRIPWKKGKFDGIRLEVDRGDGKGWQFLAVDTRPDYADTEPFPANGATWTYRAIYLQNDEKVGQWSAPVSVRVG